MLMKKTKNQLLYTMNNALLTMKLRTYLNLMVYEKLHHVCKYLCVLRYLYFKMIFVSERHCKPNIWMFSYFGISKELLHFQNIQYVNTKLWLYIISMMSRSCRQTAIYNILTDWCIKVVVSRPYASRPNTNVKMKKSTHLSNFLCIHSWIS